MLHSIGRKNTKHFSWDKVYAEEQICLILTVFPLFLCPLLLFLRCPPPLCSNLSPFHTAAGKKKKKTRSRIALLQPASVWSQPPSPLLFSAPSTPSPTSTSHSKSHSITVAKSTPPPISFLPSPLLHSHPSCALSPVLIGKSVEPCQPQQWDTWSSVKTSFPVKRPPVLIQ